MFPYDQSPISTVPDLSDQIKRTTELIGRGSYGSVYKGELGVAANPTTVAVAIKIIEIVPPRDEAQRTKRFKQITRELSLWCSIQHENILPLFGIARINGAANVPAFVSPWMENGNAKEFCSCNPHFPRMNILYDIINGLHYLHTLEPEIVHGDIKAVNVLISNSLRACLCDFGLSRFLIDNTLWKTAATHAGGTVRWMAPELINGDVPTPTKESDIYAYAMTCYEILSGDVPFKLVSNDMAIPLKVTKGQRPDRTESFYSDSMWDIITRCWEQEPEDRIPTQNVLRLLREKKEVEETLAKIGEEDVALVNVEKEMTALNDKMAKAEEDLEALKEEKEKAEEDLKISMEEKDAALAKAEEETKVLGKDQGAAERKKNDKDVKYGRTARELHELREPLEEAMAMYPAEAAELRQDTECAREGSYLLTEELMSLQHINSSLRAEDEKPKHQAEARKSVAIHQKQLNEIARLHDDVPRAFPDAEKASGNLEVHHNQTKDQLDDGVTPQPEEARGDLKQRIKEVEEGLTKIEEKGVRLAEVEDEMAVFKEKSAEARIAIKEWKPYRTSWSEHSLVIGIDVGMKLSTVSYALFSPGKAPHICPVTQFLGQSKWKHKKEVPSVVCYDQDGNVIAVGSETDPEVNPALSEMKSLWQAEWFKLRLWPSNLRAQLEKIWPSSVPTEEIDDYAGASNEDEFENDRSLDLGDSEVPEPESSKKKKMPHPAIDDFKTAVQVLADFLQYLFKSAKEYIIDTERDIDPTFAWSSIERNTYFVLTHPNVWEGKQQSQMLDAVVAAGIVDKSTAANRIIFLAEGKASLHFCLEKIPRLHPEDGGILMVECGDATIDISAYSQVERGGYGEIAAPDCLLPGFVSVTSRARDYFKKRFKGSKFGSDDGLEAMARAFAKPGGARDMFWSSDKPYHIHFAGPHDSDWKYGIDKGKFKVAGMQMANFFQPVVEDIIFAIEKQCTNAKEGISVKFVLLIGEFAQSRYLYTTLSNHFKSSSIVVLRPDIGSRKMVISDGTVYHFVHCFTSARIANYKFNPTDHEHVRCESTKFESANGIFQVPVGFFTILEKGRIVTEESQFRWPSSIYFTPEEFSQWSKYSMTIKCYKGKAASPPQWLDLEPDSFHDSCIIHADITDVKEKICPNNNRTKIYQFDFEVVIIFGVTELKAYIAWKDNGKEKLCVTSKFCKLIEIECNYMSAQKKYLHFFY